MSKNAKGMFVTFEGIDGCGKSTQLELLGKHIWRESKYNHVLFTREPYQDVVIRDILTRDDNPYTKGMELAKRFVEDRKRHYRELIEHNRNVGGRVFVLGDRYDLSTLAYQQTQGVELDALLRMHKDIPKPDLTFIVDVPVDVAIGRMKKDKKRSVEQKFEKNRKFMEKLRENYKGMFENLSDRNMVIVDNSQGGAEAVFENQIRLIFDDLVKQRI